MYCASTRIGHCWVIWQYFRISRWLMPTIVWNRPGAWMVETPGTNVGVTSEEEALKKQIAKAYMQDKDVDVAVLEEKLRLRAQWRKEILAQQKELASSEDDDGW